MTEDTISLVKQQMIKEKIITLYHKDLISLMYKELLQTKTDQRSNRKVGRQQEVSSQKTYINSALSM